MPPYVTADAAPSSLPGAARSDDPQSSAPLDPVHLDRFLSRAVKEQQANQGASQVWAEVTALGALPGVLDLGQGWPDFGADELARRAATEALVASPDPRANQYSGIPGRPELISAVARYYKSTGMSAGAGDVLVTTSATEALYVALQALCDPGDEVIFLEPFFPWYIAHCRIFGREQGGKGVGRAIEPSGGGRPSYTSPRLPRTNRPRPPHQRSEVSPEDGARGDPAARCRSRDCQDGADGRGRIQVGLGRPTRRLRAGAG